MFRSLTLIGVVLLLSIAARADDSPLQPHQQRARDIYKELIEIDTTHSTGSTTRAAEAVARRLKAAGFEEKDIWIVGPTPTKKNLVARLDGGKVKKPMLLLAHLDVVEAKREDWSMDPFVLTEQDGFFYGRGTLDDKAMAAIFTDLMIRMKEEGFTPNRDIILALTADEEGGPDNGVAWLVQNYPTLIKVGLVINEGGGGRSRDGKYIANGVQASEKTYATFQLEVKDKGGHSSLPTKDNAIYCLAAGLTRLEKYQFPVELNEVTRAEFAGMAKTESGQTAADMEAVLKDPPAAAAVARLSETPLYNATLRTTCVATRLEAGHADNALPQTARATVNCRILPGHTPEEVQRTLVQVLADDRIVVTPAEPPVLAPASPLQPKFMETVESITQQMWPGVPVVLIMSTGATDSRYFRNARIPAYGVSGLFVDIGDDREHGKDERLGVKQFFEGQTFLDRLVMQIAQ